VTNLPTHAYRAPRLGAICLSFRRDTNRRSEPTVALDNVALAPGETGTFETALGSRFMHLLALLIDGHFALKSRHPATDVRLIVRTDIHGRD
jgi:hypothetical protein